jgi:hypothetical protein
LKALEDAGGPLTLPELKAALEAAGVSLPDLDPLGRIYGVVARRPGVFAMAYGTDRTGHTVSIRPDARPEDLAMVRAMITPSGAGKATQPPRETKAEVRARAILEILASAADPLDVPEIVAALRAAGIPMPPREWSALIAVRSLLAGMPERVEMVRRGHYRLRDRPTDLGRSDFAVDVDSAAVLRVLGEAEYPLTIQEIVERLEAAGHHLPDGAQPRASVVSHVIAIRPLDIERVGKERYRLKKEDQGKAK